MAQTFTAEDDIGRWAVSSSSNPMVGLINGVPLIGSKNLASVMDLDHRAILDHIRGLTLPAEFLANNLFWWRERRPGRGGLNPCALFTRDAFIAYGWRLQPGRSALNRVAVLHAFDKVHGELEFHRLRAVIQAQAEVIAELEARIPRPLQEH